MAHFFRNLLQEAKQGLIPAWTKIKGADDGFHAHTRMHSSSNYHTCALAAGHPLRSLLFGAVATHLELIDLHWITY